MTRPAAPPGSSPGPSPAPSGPTAPPSGSAGPNGPSGRAAPSSPKGRPVGRGGLFWRVFSTFFGAVLVFVALASVVLVTTRPRHDAGWVEATDAVIEQHRPALLAALAGEGDLEREIAALAAKLELRLALRDHQGALLAGDRDVAPIRNLHPRQRRRLERGAAVMLRGRSGDPQLVFAIGERALLVADTGLDAARRTRFLVAGALGLVALLGASAWFLARSLTRRLAVLEDGAARIARGDLHHPIPIHAPGDEIDRLGQAMNDMAAQLGELLRGQRALLANVSHELKTPIARLRVLAELISERAEALPEHPASARIRQGALELEQDLGELATLVQDLLTSGRLELSGPHASPIQRDPIELLPFLARVAAPYDAEVAVVPADLTVPGDALLLDRLLVNLLSNARRACPSGHVWVRAEVERTNDGDMARISVEDEGPGIPPEERTRVFEAFYRLDDARARDHGGVGLGLYLCAQIARAHGGTIVAEDRGDAPKAPRAPARGAPDEPAAAEPAPHGARLVVRLPLAPADGRVL